jgi:acetyl-CoA C-acetyltransferase
LGSFNGALSSIPAPKLGAAAIKAAVERSGVAPDQIDEAIMGCVIPASLGQAPARQAVIHAGLPTSVGALTVNKVCGSGLKAVGLGAQMIQCGDAKIIVAGGMENMSGAPHALKGSREGIRMGHAQMLDLMIHDGLWDAYHNCHMGSFADDAAKEQGITREDLDAFAAESYRRANQSIADGIFKDEIAPVEVPQKKGAPFIVDTDEEPGRVNYDKIPSLKPAFNKDGVVTAANASSINDGAAAVVLCDAEYAKQKGLKPMARYVAQAIGPMNPNQFPYAPVLSIERVLAKAGLTKDDIDLFEINQAFAVVSIYTQRKLGLDPSKIDVFGGAVALGHPIGASGARVLVTLLYAMKKRNAKRGLASLCLGGGEAVAMIVEGVNP